MSVWHDILKIWKLATEEPDPVTRRKKNRDITGAGVTSPDIPDIRSDGGYLAPSRNNLLRLRDSTDFIDLSSVTNRQSRYKEYERLRTVPEIETALTVYSDESCVVGDTQVATPFGYFPIKKLAEEKEPDEEFLVYCYDFKQEDFTLGWAYHPRLVKKEYTVTVIVDNGKTFTCTPDHKILLREGKWVHAGDLKDGDELMPFHRVRPHPKKSGHNTLQFPCIYTLKDSWKTERQFLDEWKTGNKTEEQEKFSKIIRLIASGLESNQISKLMKVKSLKYFFDKNGTSYKEVDGLNKLYLDRRRVLRVKGSGEYNVYDISVDGHENFATDITIFHNCQVGDNGHLFRIDAKNEEIREELDFLFFNPGMLNIDRKLWNICKNLYLRGDHFLELIIDINNPKDGIIGFQSLPADSVYRIETIKSKLLEFQQSREGPDYQSLARTEITKATQADLAQATAIRFAPKQVVHLRIGDDRQTYYPYGVSIVDAARGPAHNMKLMLDSVMTYRLSRSPERRIFYIDVGHLPPFKTEAFMERMKDLLRKRKTYSSRGGGQGASAVEERWVAPSMDEDFFVPIRPNSNTRIETLPGAQNTGIVEDLNVFRDQLLVALNFPKIYLAAEDIQITKLSISSTDVKFANMIERLQMSISDGLTEIAIRHLELRGFPAELYEDLKIRMTPPSYHREISQNEVMQVRYDRAMSLKGSQLWSDLDIMTRILKIPEDEAKEITARATIQRLQELKLQIMAQNPQLLGIAMPGQGGQEMGTTPQGPNPQLNPEGQPPEGQPPEGQEGQPAKNQAADTYGQPEGPEPKPLPEPEPEELKKYDLEIMDYSKGQDEEELDMGELDEF